MTKYTSVQKKETPRKTRQVHPIWRWIGCAFMLLIPLVSYALGVWTVNYGFDHNWPIPYKLLGNPTLPDFVYKSNLLAQLLSPYTTWTNFYAYAVVALLYMIVLGGILSFVNALVYQLVGPPRWGPLDVPPPKIKTKGYKR